MRGAGPSQEKVVVHLSASSLVSDNEAWHEVAVKPELDEAGPEGAEQDQAVYRRAEGVRHVAVAEVEQVLEEEAGGERS